MSLFPWSALLAVMTATAPPKPTVSAVYDYKQLQHFQAEVIFVNEAGLNEILAPEDSLKAYTRMQHQRYVQEGKHGFSLTFFTLIVRNYTTSRDTLYYPGRPSLGTNYPGNRQFGITHKGKEILSLGLTDTIKVIPGYVDYTFVIFREFEPVEGDSLFIRKRKQ